MSGKGSPVKLGTTGVKGTKPKEAKHADRFCDDSPAKKMKASKSPVADGSDGFETAWSGPWHHQRCGREYECSPEKPEPTQHPADNNIRYLLDSLPLDTLLVDIKSKKREAVAGHGRGRGRGTDAVRDINLLFTKYAEVLRERAAREASQVQELTNILNEAMSLESQFKEKKEQLRQSLAVISDKLQG